MLHNCMEAIYKDDDEDDTTINNIPGREDRFTYGEVKLNQELYIEKLFPAYEATEEVLDRFDIDIIEVEPFVQLIEGEAGGSIDMVGLSADGKTALILDYKFGFHGVEAEYNPQMLFYALCAAVDPVTAELFEEVENLVLCIIQPNGEGDVADLWITGIEVLDDFEEQVYDAIDYAKADNATDHPKAGDWCKYCPAESTCPAKTGEAQKALRLDLDQVEQLAIALNMVNSVEAWAKEVRKRAHEQLEQGVDVPGFKLVAKRASRKWTSEQEVMDKVRKMRKVKIEEATDMKLKSPPQLEKVLKQKDVDFKQFEDYIVSVSSGTTIAPESDKRAALLPTGALEELGKRLA